MPMPNNTVNEQLPNMETGNTPAPLSDAAIAEKERLFIEKLRLDNEEQQARIAQLQIQWWQKPKAQYAIIVPFCTFVAFLAHNVVKDEINQATIQKQKNEIENQRLEFVQRQLTPRVAQLQRAEDKLIENAFRRYTDVCEIGGRIAAAESAEAAVPILEEFDKLLTFTRIEWLMKNIKACVIDPKTGETLATFSRSEVASAALSLSNECQRDFQEKYAEQFPKAIRNLAIAIYGETIDVANELRESTDRDDAKNAIAEFSRLYYGKLVLIENKRVVTAMVNTRNELLEWHKRPLNRDVLDRLIKSLTEETNKLQKQNEKELMSGESKVEPNENPKS